jgi:hypothetical protein
VKTAKNWLAVVAVICLLLVVTGCTPSSDEAQIESVVNGYASAISSQNWNKARSYCVEGSTPYTAVDGLEDIINQSSGSISIDYSITISNISINDSYATVSGSYALIISGGGQSMDDSGNITFNLQKVDGTWKLY